MVLRACRSITQSFDHSKRYFFINIFKERENPDERMPLMVSQPLLIGSQHINHKIMIIFLNMVNYLIKCNVFRGSQIILLIFLMQLQNPILMSVLNLFH